VEREGTTDAEFDGRACEDVHLTILVCTRTTGP
jgi:hypothetical protein